MSPVGLNTAILSDSSVEVPMIPETLEGWSLDFVRALAAPGIFETNRFDFKECLPHRDDHGGKQRLREAAAAFANSAGGFLVFGVKDDRNLSVDERVVGVDPQIDFPQQFGAFPAAAEPSVDWTPRTPALTLPSGRLVHVIGVRASAARPHGVDVGNGRWLFPKRTNKGTEAMTYQEVRAAFVNAAQRRSDLLLVRAEVERMMKLAERLNIEWSNSELNGGVVDPWVPPYNTSLLVGTLPRVFEALASSDTLVGNVNELREAAEAADQGMPRVGRRSHTLGDEADLAAMAGLVIRQARLVQRAAQLALPDLVKLVK